MFSHKDVLPSGRILVFMITLGKTFFYLSVSTFIIASKTYTLYKKLGEIEQELTAPCFLRCHQSFLVNMNYVKAVDKDFTLTNDDVVLIRKKNLKELRQIYFDYRKQIHNRY